MCGMCRYVKRIMTSCYVILHVSTSKWTVPKRCDSQLYTRGLRSFCTFVVLPQSLPYILTSWHFSFMPSGMAESQSSEEFTGLRQRSASDSNIISSTSPSGGTHVRDDYHAQSKRTGVSRFFLRLIRPWTWRRKHRSKKLEETAVSEFEVTRTHIRTVFVQVWWVKSSALRD